MSSKTLTARRRPYLYLYGTQSSARDMVRIYLVLPCRAPVCWCITPEISNAGIGDRADAPPLPTTLLNKEGHQQVCCGYQPLVL